MLIRLWYHARIRSWNQPVLSNKGKSCLLKETTGAFDGPRTHNFQITSHFATPSFRIVELFPMVCSQYLHRIILLHKYVWVNITVLMDTDVEHFGKDGDL